MRYMDQEDLAAGRMYPDREYFRSSDHGMILDGRYIIGDTKTWYTGHTIALLEPWGLDGPTNERILVPEGWSVRLSAAGKTDYSFFEIRKGAS